MIELRVTNELDRLVGRANCAFEPGENDPVKVDASRLAEITDCKYLDAVIVGADDPMEIPSDFAGEIAFNATDAAITLAVEHGISPRDLLNVGTGAGGQATVSDVKDLFSKGSSSDGIEAGIPSVGQATTPDEGGIRDDAEEQAMDTVGEPEVPEDHDLIEGTVHPANPKTKKGFESSGTGTRVAEDKS